MSLGHGASIVRDGLVLYLDAANPKSYTSGTTWFDLSGNNDGTLINGVGYSADNKGAMVFDGVNDTIDCGQVSSVGSSLLGLTISMWVNPAANATAMYAENGTTFTTNTFYLAQENTAVLTFLVYGEGGYDLVEVSSPNPYPINTWFNIVGTWSSGTRCKLFYNAEDKTKLRGGAIRNTLINGNTNLYIGSRNNSSIFYRGNVGSTSIYNRALTEVEIKQNFEATRGRYGI
jgi:hypothetical protein